MVFEVSRVIRVPSELEVQVSIKIEYANNPSGPRLSSGLASYCQSMRYGLRRPWSTQMDALRQNMA